MRKEKEPLTVVEIIIDNVENESGTVQKIPRITYSRNGLHLGSLLFESICDLINLRKQIDIKLKEEGITC